MVGLIELRIDFVDNKFIVDGTAGGLIRGGTGC